MQISIYTKTNRIIIFLNTNQRNETWPHTAQEIFKFRAVRNGKLLALKDTPPSFVDTWLRLKEREENETEAEVTEEAISV